MKGRSIYSTGLLNLNHADGLFWHLQGRNNVFLSSDLSAFFFFLKNSLFSEESHGIIFKGLFVCLYACEGSLLSRSE